MAKRGRPRHPDILTPREWEVLALVREGLSNEQIAERLGTTERTARYHVSEILSKLGVSTRQEAAAWQPEARRPWWTLALAPLAFGRRIGHHWLASAVAGAAGIAVIAALAVLLWGITRTQSRGTVGPAALAVGEQHACVLLDGGVKCWGRNIWGELGDGTNQDRSSPVPVAGLDGRVAAISAGAAHTCALFPAGNVKCWGYNIYGQLGDGGGGGGVANANSPQPVDVAGLIDAIAISAGGGHTCALTSAGGVKCWGDNTFGQMGDGTTTMRNTPVDVTGLTSGVRAVAAGGNFTCALMAVGNVKCWGSNAQGQLGAAASEQCGSPLYRPPCSTTPLDVTGLASGVTAVVAGPQQHVCAITTGGALKCWGRNAAGDLGVATTTSCSGAAEPCSSVPLAVDTLGRDVRGAGLGAHHTCAALSSGGVKCWGSNGSGQLGDGTAVDHAVPASVVGLSDQVVAIGGGDGHTCALISSGAVKCWGTDELGQLGDGTNGDEVCSCRKTPVDVAGLTDEQPASATVVPAAQLDWQSADHGTQIVSGPTGFCGDSATATVYSVPARLQLQTDAAFQAGTTLFGLEAEPYQYVAAQVVPLGSWSGAPEGWQIVERYVLNSRAAPNRMGYNELFLRRLDQPALLFRYSDDLCNPDGSPAQPPEKLPGLTLDLPPDLPHVVMHRQAGYLSAQEAINIATRNQPAGVRPVWLELGTSAEILDAHGLPTLSSLSNNPDQVIWVVVLDAGDNWGPKRPGHAYGMFMSIDASTASTEGLGGGCCLDLLTAP